ncbi:MAG: SOS response-associated peptidase family protein [Candidatus Methylomirabilota bacterium]
MVPTLLRPAPDSGRQFRLLPWGLIPSWAEDPRIGNRLINTRAETVAKKPAFRDRRLALLTLVESFNRVRGGWVLTGWPLLVNVRRVVTNERPGFFDIR